MRNEYEVLKREVYARHAMDTAAYNDGKDSWVKRVEHRVHSTDTQRSAANFDVTSHSRNLGNGALELHVERTSNGPDDQAVRDHSPGSP